MDTEKLIQKYHNVSGEEIENIRETNDHEGLCETIGESTVSTLHSLREYEKMNGKESVIVGPLIHVLSVKFLPDKSVDHQEPLTVSGRIYTQFRDNNSGRIIVHDLYNRNSHDAQVLGSNGNGSLTLTDPHSSWPLICMPLHDTRFVVDVAVGGKTLGARYICCEDDMTDFEQVNQKDVLTDVGVFALRYIAMPFAIYGHVQVTFHHKQGCKLDGRNHSFLDVKGKIVACYGNTFEGYNSEECTLFDKQSNDFERVDFEQQKYPLRGISMRLSRCWIGLPVYSSLIVDLNLFEFGSERKILKEILEFQVNNKHFSYKNFTVDDILVSVSVRWNSPMPQGKQNEKERGMDSEDESSDEEISLQGTSKDNSDDEQMIESCVPEASSSLIRPWLGVHQSMPLPSSLVEIYSIYIGRDKFKALLIYGFVEISTLGNTIYCFNRETNDAFRLLEGSKTIPVLDGCLIYDDCDSLKMKIDFKDVESSLRIRGYVDWDDRTLEFGTQWFNKPLCSFVEGQHGFAAIYYSFFPEAVKANLMILCTPKQRNGSRSFEVFPKVYGSIFAQHNYFDYTCRYNKDNYRVAVFQRNAEDPLQTSANGVIPLSRSMVVVPLHSSLVIGLNLSMSVGDDQVSFNSTVDLRIGTSNFSVEAENNDYSIHIYVKWVD